MAPPRDGVPSLEQFRGSAGNASSRPRIRANERSYHKLPEFVIPISFSMTTVSSIIRTIVMSMVIIVIVIISEDILPARIGSIVRG